MPVTRRVLRGTDPDRPVQVDPYGCGCTECLTGEYVPLDQADAATVIRMLRNEISDATGCSFIEDTDDDDGRVLIIAYRGDEPVAEFDVPEGTVLP